MNFEVGSTVGDYQIIGILGTGGMGQVYKVRNVIMDRIEAMKVLLPDLAGQTDLANRFLREIKVHASLEHPNIAALHTAVRIDNQLLMLIEFVDGVTLEQKLKDGPIPVAGAVDYVRQVLSALEYAHAHGVVHRDIKPANMMLTPAGVVKLMDFGIAKPATDDTLTKTGTTMGSLYYMSPEQIQGSGEVDQRSDLYSLGVSLYQLVTGKRPFDGDSQFAIMAAHLEKTPVPPIELDPKLPPLLSDAIMLSVMRDPNARFQSAAAFRNALSNLEGEETVPAPPPAAAQMAKPRGKRALWMAVGAVTAVLALIGVIEFGPRKGTKAAPETASSAPATVPAPAAQPQPQSREPQSPGVTLVQPAEPKPASETAPAPKRQDQAAAQRTPRSQAPQPAAQQLPGQPGAAQLIIQQPIVQSPAPQPPTIQPPAAPQPDAGVRAALQEVRQQLSLLTVRANGIRASLKRLEIAQAAAGLGLNASLQEPLGLMNSYLDEAANALNAGDAASAKSFTEKGEKQAERLEKALNR